MRHRSFAVLGHARRQRGVAAVELALLLPMLVVAWLSVHRWDLLGPITFVGLDNWRSVLTDSTFGVSLLVTVGFIALVIPVQTALGLFAASMLAHGLPGTGFSALDAGQKAQVAAIAAGFVGLLSLFNILGRFFWASMSDRIGRKVTYAIFFALGIALYAAAPSFAAAGSQALFVLAFCIIL